jgi:hypothetical protein
MRVRSEQDNKLFTPRTTGHDSHKGTPANEKQLVSVCSR